MPDHENTFVLKSDNGREDEFVVEAGDKEDMKSWLAAIRTCMRYSFNYRRSGLILRPARFLPASLFYPLSSCQTFLASFLLS